ncbi:MAG: NAD(P)H-dependent oxidoreductase subunit E [Firmicutes bacterium]|nr:NAD(P)H-dependent oxidoreductase subunit E [Bacillota bacterium]
MQTLHRTGISEEIKKLAEKYGKNRTSLLPIMHELTAKYGRITDEMMQETADALGIRPIDVYSTVSFYTFFNEKTKGKYIVRLCQTISCDMDGKSKVARQLENELGIKFGETTPDGLFTLEYANCLGMCDQGPAVMINHKIFTKVTPGGVHQLLEECRKGKLDKIADMGSVRLNIIKSGPILDNKETENEGLKKALAMSRVDLIKEIRDSNLKGRGGAGFPTGVKWQIAAASKGEKKYVVCNADEGEPGTFKDRILMVEYPHRLIEGMTIASYAIGAEYGIIYLRAEYFFMKSHIEQVIEDRKSANLLGTNILGKEGFNFDVEIRMGAGAYVCGEETALIESLEGKRGEPRNRPPFPVVTGFDNYPTAVNNVETFVAASLIAAKGAEWFTEHGTEKTSGTKLMSISGDCANPGIYELPMGVTIDEMLIMAGGTGAKAVQVGGASGSCVPASQFDRKITYEDVATGGSIIIFGPNRDMLEVAKNFMEFFVEESCGQCFPCRKGNVKILEGIKLLEKGKCSTAYLSELISLGQSMQKASKCGLGQTSANAFINIIQHFGNEILARDIQE